MLPVYARKQSLIYKYDEINVMCGCEMYVNTKYLSASS